MRKAFAGLAIIITCSLHAQQTVIPLYEGVAPGSENSTQKEVEYSQFGGKMIRNVVNPTLTVYLPEEGKATGAAVIVAPGGGFCWLSWESEGTMVGEWLQAHGIAAFILKYRLADMGQKDDELMKNAQEFMGPVISIANSNKPKEELKKYPKVARVIALAEDDGRQAVKYVRSNASMYKINPDRIGLMGFSAGGIITMGVALHHDNDSRPDFIAPIYGLAMDSLVVPEDAAPMFFTCAADDGIVAPLAPKLFKAWQSAGKSIEFHVYSKGGHGFGMRKRGLPVDNWIDQFREWLNVQGFLK
jgi:acetyl esterase/lipase